MSDKEDEFSLFLDPEQELAAARRVQFGTIRFPIIRNFAPYSAEDVREAICANPVYPDNDVQQV